MMFVSAYPVCSPALPVSYWAEAAVAAASTNPRVFEQHPGHRRHQQHPTTNAFSGDAVKRPSSFYISDILYPSVIPLPGTLPHGSNSSSPCDAESPLSSPDRQTGDSRGATSLVATSVATKMVKSSDLKFGIDRILADDVKSKDGHPVGGLDKKTVTPKPTLAAPTPVISYCPCSAPPPTSYGMVYTPLSYSSAHVSHPLVQIQHAAHPAARPPTTVSGGYHQMSRQSDFPGPYAALASDSHQPQQQQPKRKRSWSRAVFSNLQRKGLEKRFEVQKYVTKPDRRQLAAMLGLTDAQVKVWFQNRRMKWRHAEDAKRKRDEDETCKGDGTDSEKENGMTVECVDSVIKMNDLQHADLQDVVNGEIVNGDNTMQTSDSESDSEHEMMLDS